MKLHANHRTCARSRRLICRRVFEECWTLARAAEAAGCSERTARKWLRRYREGDHELHDRSSRPRRSPSRLSDERVRVIEVLRRLGMSAAEIAEILRLPLSTVCAWLKRIGLGKRSRLEPPEPANRYERRHPGELVHVDIKRLKAERFIQTLLREWAYGELYGSSDERTANLPRFLRRHNFRRPHGSLGKQAPASRLNNLVGNYT